jgi:hypothetical protein
MRGWWSRARARRCLRIAIVTVLLVAGSSFNCGTALPAAAKLSLVDPDVAAEDARERVRPPANRSAARVTTGLDVTIDQVNPASLEPATSVQISGTVTNVDPRRWIDLQAYLVVGDEAITTPEQLDAVLKSSADAYSGERIGTTPGRRILYDELSSLAPGESTPYALDVPFSELGLSDAANGVYTVSVHVLGQRVDQARLEGADGRARILLPYLSDAQEPTGLTVAIPLHHPVRRLPDGTFEGVESLIDSISSGGLLRNRLDLVAAALTGQATLLVDPALLDVLRALANDGSEPAEGDAQTGGADEQTEQQAVAADFLNRLELAATRSGVLVEPYGRADLTALAQGRQYHLGPMVTNQGEQALETSSITGEPTYFPTGQLRPAALRLVARRRTVLVSDNQLTGWSTADGALAQLGAGRRRVPVVVADTSLDNGGLAPGPTDSALHLRQRLLAESAVLSLAGEDAILVFVPEEDWDPGPGPVGDELFDQLDTPWVFSNAVSVLAAPGPRPLVPGAAAQALEAPPLPSSVLQAVARLRRHGKTLEAVMTPDPTMPSYQQSAVLALSADLRDDPDAAQEYARAATATIDEQLDQISLAGPQAVTLSSNTGPFPITITNRTDEPVTVGAHVFADDAFLEVESVEPQEIAPGSQVTVNVQVTAPNVGVTTVSARLVTAAGREFGQPITFPLRSSVVGEIIWYAMGAAGVFVLLLVLRRIGRRLRPPTPRPEHVS